MIDLITIKKIEHIRSESVEHFKDSINSTDSAFSQLLDDKIKNENKVEEKLNDEEHLGVLLVEEENDEEPLQENKFPIEKQFTLSATNVNQENDEKSLNLKKIETTTLIDAKQDVITQTASLSEKIQELLSTSEKIEPANAEKIIASIKEFLASPESANLNDKTKRSLSQLVETLTAKLAKNEPFTLPAKIDLKQILADIGKKTTQNERAAKQAAQISNEKIEVQQKTEVLKEANIETTQAIKQDVSENKKSESIIFNNRTSIFENKNSLNNQSQAQNNFNQNREFREQINALLEKGKIQIKDAKNASFEIKLNPKELGNLNMNIGITQGVVTGKFLVETEGAKNLLMENLQHIRTQLEESGVAIGDFQVNVRKENRDNIEDIELKTARVLNSALEISAIVDYNSTLIHDGSLNLVI